MDYGQWTNSQFFSLVVVVRRGVGCKGLKTLKHRVPYCRKITAITSKLFRYLITYIWVMHTTRKHRAGKSRGLKFRESLELPNDFRRLFRSRPRIESDGICAANLLASEDRTCTHINSLPQWNNFRYNSTLQYVFYLVWNNVPNLVWKSKRKYQKRKAKTRLRFISSLSWAVHFT